MLDGIYFSVKLVPFPPLLYNQITEWLFFPYQKGNWAIYLNLKAAPFL